MHDAGGPLWYEQYFGPDYLLIDVHSDTEKEIDFITAVLELEKGKKVLDVGCGYGRHLIPLFKRGFDVYGVDLSRFMLEKTANKIGVVQPRSDVEKGGPETGKKDRLVQCDNRALPFFRVFDCAVNMFNSFGYFESEQDNFQMLQSIAGALKPGGLFLLDLVNRDYVLRNLQSKDWFEHDGAVILENKWFESKTNRMEIDESVLDLQGKRNHHYSIRLYSYTELVMLLEAAGFAVKAAFGGFNGEEFDLHYDRMLILSQSLDLEEE